MARRRRHLFGTADTFDIRDWRLGARWRNDKRVGDSAMAKMLAGIDPDRFEALAGGELGEVRVRH